MDKDMGDGCEYAQATNLKNYTTKQVYDMREHKLSDPHTKWKQMFKYKIVVIKDKCVKYILNLLKIYIKEHLIVLNVIIE